MGMYDQLYNDPEFLQMLIGNMRQNSPSPEQPEKLTPWQTGLGIGQATMQTAAPIAGMLLNRQRPRPQMPAPVSTGSRPPFQMGNPYGQGSQVPNYQSMLVRYLLGGR